MSSRKFSVSFKAHLINLVRTLFLIALQTVYCKPATPVKKGLLEISRKEHTMQMLDFSTELQNTEVSVTLLKGDSTTDALPAILNIFRTNKGNTCGGVSFRYSYRRVY